MTVLGDRGPARVALLSTFTASPLEPAVRFWAEELNWRARIVPAPYGQLVQSLLDLDPSNPPDAVAVLLRWQDWLRHSTAREEPERAVTVLEGRLTELTATLADVGRTVNGPVVVLVLPPSPAYASPDWSGVLAHLDDQLTRACAGLDRVGVVSVRSRRVRGGVEVEDDETSDHLAHIPYSPAFFTALGALLIRVVAAAVSTRLPGAPLGQEFGPGAWADVTGGGLDDGRLCLPGTGRPPGDDSTTALHQRYQQWRRRSRRTSGPQREEH